MQQCSEQDLKVRDHIHKLLHEAESLEQLKTTLMDPNSLSEIMSVIRQHTEKKKAFGQQDFINKILQNSIGQTFSKRTQAETREGFQKFIKVYTQDMQSYMNSQKDSFMVDTVTLKTQ